MTQPTPAWFGAVDRLVLEVGAELVVADPDGGTAFQAPLARAWRLEENNPAALWLRPLAPPVLADDGTRVFALSLCRRRVLLFSGVDLRGQMVCFSLVNGQEACIRPVTGDSGRVLEQWDTFVGARLTAEEELELDALAEDSWYGRYS